MKKKVNLRIVEGDEFSVAKNELLYNKVNNEISLKKRNSKGVLEEITKGNLENKNIVQLYPEDPKDACTLDSLSELVGLFDQKGIDSFWGEEVNTTFGGVIVRGDTEENKKFINKVLDIIKKWVPEGETYANFILADNKGNQDSDACANFAYTQHDNTATYVLRGYFGYYWIDIMVGIDEIMEAWCLMEIPIYASKLSLASLKLLLNVNSLADVTKSTVSTTLDKTALLQTLYDEGATIESIQMIRGTGLQLGFKCTLTPKNTEKLNIPEYGFTGDFIGIADLDSSNPKYIKGTIDATPSTKDATKFDVTTTVTSVSN